MSVLQSHVRVFVRQAVCALPLLGLTALTHAQAIEFSSLDEAPAIQQRIRDERQQGNLETAWDLEQALLALVAQHPADVRSARIIRDVGDYRLDILSRYTSGEYTPEIVLGCYYLDNQDHTEVRQRGSTPMMSSSARRAETNTCAVGSNHRAMLALAEEAESWYVQSARILMQNEQATADEVRDVAIKAAATSYRVSDYRTGRSVLNALLTYQTEHGASAVARAETLALLGDWDLLFVEHFGSRYADSAGDSYAQVIALLNENDVSESEFNSIFPPQTPILLPAFSTHSLSTQQTPAAAGYVDIAFEIRDTGKATRIDVVGASPDLPREVERDVVNTIKFSRFRPIAANGQLLESAPVTVRYYVSD